MSVTRTYTATPCDPLPLESYEVEVPPALNVAPDHLAAVKICELPPLFKVCEIDRSEEHETPIEDVKGVIDSGFTVEEHQACKKKWEG